MCVESQAGKARRLDEGGSAGSHIDREKGQVRTAQAMKQQRSRMSRGPTDGDIMAALTKTRWALRGSTGAG